jgi:glycosyl transferase, family 25
MHAFVINLDRSADRRAHMTAELARAGVEYEFVTGVDGRDLDFDAELQKMDPDVVRQGWILPGVLGCGSSHLRVYRQIMSAGLPHALVLEDDVQLPADLAGILDALPPHLVGAEVVLLNYDSKSTCQMSSAGSASLSAARALVLPIDVGQPVSGAAYVITWEACKRLSDNMFPLRAMPDDWGFYFRQGMVDRLRCVAPMAVTKHPGFGSTVDYTPPTSVKMRTRDFIVRLDVPPFPQMIAYRRQRIFRRQTQVELVEQPFIEKPSRLD